MGKLRFSRQYSVNNLKVNDTLIKRRLVNAR
jgi:hypothetical protein